MPVSPTATRFKVGTLPQSGICGGESLSCCRLSARLTIFVVMLFCAVPHNAWCGGQASGLGLPAHVLEETTVPPASAMPPPAIHGNPTIFPAHFGDTSRTAASPPPYPTDVPVAAVVLRIADGDTLVVDIPGYPPIIGRRIAIRVAGCDTPERNDARPHIRDIAHRATYRTRQMAPPGSTVYLHNIKRDKYFRLLADVETPTGDLGTRLIDEGLAKAYSGGRRQW